MVRRAAIESVASITIATLTKKKTRVRAGLNKFSHKHHSCSRDYVGHRRQRLDLKSKEASPNETMFPDTGGRPGLRAPFSPSLYKYTLASSLVCRREKLKQTTGSSSRVMIAQAGRKSAKWLWVDSQSAPAPPPAHPQASVSKIHL